MPFGITAFGSSENSCGSFFICIEKESRKEEMVVKKTGSRVGKRWSKHLAMALILLLVAVSGSVAVCTKKGETGSQDKTVEFKLAHFWQQHIPLKLNGSAWARDVEKATNGR
jgi:hypothetical protein